METTLVRTSSFPVHALNQTPSKSNVGSHPLSPKILFRSEKANSNANIGFVAIRRSNSDPNLLRCEMLSPRMGLQDLSAIVEEDKLGVGNGKGNKYGGNNGKGEHNDSDDNYGNNDENGNNKMDEYYQQMLKSNPGDPLVLRNYGKYLHEVEKNVEKAEEYYGRAILADPEDGELLALYGNLIWEMSKDEDRARLYYGQALHTSPKDCTVLGSYAHFLWGAKDDDDEEEEEEEESKPENDVVHSVVGVHLV